MFSNLSSLAKFAWGVLVYNIGVILWGAYVRATGSGAGCGDHWPLCNGVVIPRDASAQTAIEFSHRVTAGLALVAVVVLLVWVWRACAAGHPARRAAGWTAFFMGLEAAIGAGLVLFRMVADNESIARGMWMAAHLVNTFVLLAWMTLTAWYLSGGAPVRAAGRRGSVAALSAAAFGLLLVGMSGAVAALGDTLFPQGSLSAALAADLSPTSHLFVRLRILHPTLAVLTSIALIFGLPRLARGPGAARLGRWVAALAAAQLLLGAVNVVLLAPVWMQLVHLLVADLLWIAFVLFGAQVLSARLERASTTPLAAAPAPVQPLPHGSAHHWSPPPFNGPARRT